MQKRRVQLVSWHKLHCPWRRWWHREKVPKSHLTSRAARIATLRRPYAFSTLFRGVLLIEFIFWNNLFFWKFTINTTISFCALAPSFWPMVSRLLGRLWKRGDLSLVVDQVRNGFFPIGKGHARFTMSRCEKAEKGPFWHNDERVAIDAWYSVDEKTKRAENEILAVLNRAEKQVFRF